VDAGANDGFRLVQEHKFDLEKARAAAAAAGVPDEHLQVAVHAYRALANKADPVVRREAVDALRALGDGRTSAIVAVLYGVEGGELGGGFLRALLAAAHVPGLEHHFVDLLRDEASPAWVKQETIRHAGALDSEAVRVYLVDRLTREEDRYTFATIAMALGGMKERRAVGALRDALARSDEWRPFDRYAIHSLGNIGGADAENALLAYIDGPRPQDVVAAIRALASIAPDRARARAQAILDAAPPWLSSDDRKTLEQAAR
jgi:HEAT repeat protein